MNKFSPVLFLFSIIFFIQHSNAADSGLKILGNLIVSQNEKVNCNGVKLHVYEDAQLQCGNINTKLKGQPATVITTIVINDNNPHRVIPHTIAGNITINKDGVFINAVNITKNKLSNTILLTSTSNIKTSSLIDYSVKDNNIAPETCILLNGESYHNKQAGNSTTILEPGTKITGIEENSKGQIYGGIVDFTKYVAIDIIDNKPQLKADVYKYNAVTKEQCNNINAHIKNSFIKLFNKKDIDNVKKKLTIDDNIDPIDNTTNTNKILFNKVKFTQCLSEVPSNGIYTGYGEEYQLINKKQHEPDYLKYKGDDNTDVVKKLFNGNLNPIITSDSLINEYNIKFKNVGCYKSFAELFTKYINYNCYIKTTDSDNYKLSETISDEVIQNGITYPLSNDHPIDNINIILKDNIKIFKTNPQQYINNETSAYIQVRGKNVKNINLTSDEEDRTLHVYNEWIDFNGTVSVDNISNIIQEYSPINRKYKGYSIQLQSNNDVNYIFRKNGIIDLNYLPVDNDKVNIILKSIKVTEGIDSAHKHKVRCNKHKIASNTEVIVDSVTIEKNTVLKFLPGTTLILGNPNS